MTPDRAGLEVVASTSDGAAGGSQDGQHHTDDDGDDAEGPQDGDLQHEPSDEQDDSKNDHQAHTRGRCSRVLAVLVNVERPPACSAAYLLLGWRLARRSGKRDGARGGSIRSRRRLPLARPHLRPGDQSEVADGDGVRTYHVTADDDALSTSTPIHEARLSTPNHPPRPLHRTIRREKARRLGRGRLCRVALP